MSQRRIKKKSFNAREREMYDGVVKAAEGLHGDPLGFNRFIRKLPDVAVHSAAPGALHSDRILLWIALHAKLVVDGDPKAGVQQDFFEENNCGMLYRIRRMLGYEWLRRIPMVRVRYPQDPFTEPPEVGWWSTHPAVDLLRRLPEEQRERLEDALLDTGDMALLGGHLMVLPESEKEKFADAAEEIDRNSRALLKTFEEQFRDSEHLAYSADFMGKDWPAQSV